MGKNRNYHASKGSVRTSHNAKESKTTSNKSGGGLKNTGKK